MLRPTIVRGAILDVDGTLVNSNDAHAHAWVRAFTEGGHEIRYDQVRPLMGMGGDKIIPELTGLNPHGAAGKLIASRRREIFARDYLTLLWPEPGARHLVLALKERGIRTVVASSAEEAELTSLLKIADVQDLVEHAVSKDEAGGHSKPDPDAVSAALHFMGLPPEEVVMIGDTPYDIQAAARLGIGTIALRCGGFSSQDLADAIAVYNDPQDLTNDLDDSPIFGKHAA